MKRARITDRLRDPQPVHDHEATCQGKDWFPSAVEARRGWLQGIYKCCFCTGWHRTTHDPQ